VYTPIALFHLLLLRTGQLKKKRKKKMVVSFRQFLSVVEWFEGVIEFVESKSKACETVLV
jgi:hypothetical protein